MVIAIIRTDRNDGIVGLHRVQKFSRSARLATMMGNFQHVGRMIYIHIVARNVARDEKIVFAEAY